MANLYFNKLKKTDAIWLPQIPEHWELVKVRHLFKESTKKGFPNETLLVASQKHGVVSKDAYGKRTVEATKDLHNLKLVEIGDYVISLRSFQGGIELAYERGIISPAYTIMKETKLIDKRYFKNLFKSPPFISLMTLCVKGIREGQNIDYPTFKNEYLPFPPIEEQKAIAEYLDKKNNEIDKFIRNKEKLIRLATEQKRVTINNAITQGINPTASMIEIGLEWLKKMPEHWEIKKWKYVFNIRNGQVDPKRYPNKILLAPNHIESGSGKILYKETAIEQGAESGKYLVKAGDIVYSKIRPELNKVCIAEDDGLCSADMYAIHSKKEFNQQFLMFLFLSESFNKAMVESSMRVAMPKVNREDVKNYQSAFPDADEQQQIVDSIERETMKLNKVISKVQQEITSIKEYREALITDLVTGKRSIPQIQSS